MFLKAKGKRLTTEPGGRIVHPLFPNDSIRTVNANEEISYLNLSIILI